MAKVSLEKEKIKILLLEGLHPSSVEAADAEPGRLWRSTA